MPTFDGTSWWAATAEQYYASTRVGSTQLARALGIDGPTTKTGDLGRARHLAVFEPDRIAEEIAIRPADTMRGSGKGQTERLAAWQAEHAGQIQLNADEMADVFDLAAAVERHVATGRLLRHPGVRREQAFQATDLDTRIELRGRLDAYLLGRLFDMKSSRAPDLDTFERSSVLNYGYHVQAAYYLDAVADIEPVQCFVWVVVSTQKPYRIGFYEVGQQWLELGRRGYRAALMILAAAGSGPLPRYWDQHPLLADSPPRWSERWIELAESLADDLHGEPWSLR
jgi:hypothetical protein